jgi:hypothetical protein
MRSSRALRRLTNLANAVIAKAGADPERALILRTILKILDECSESEYDVATTGVMRGKLIAAGVVFDAE